jgi:predicted ATPase/DNA-binding SARP family transcriptional activator
MPRLSLALLGPLQVILDGAPISAFESDKVRALLAYLAVEADRPHRRDALAGLLWSDRPERAAHLNLNQALANLRGAIGDRTATPSFLSITRETVQFNRASDYELDVEIFTALLAACEQHLHRHPETCTSCVQRLRQAADLYRGSFLAQFFLSDSAAFEEWALLKREWLQRRALRALGCLADYHERRRDYEQAQHYIRRQLELDAWREESHRQLMRVLALSGQRSAALAQYERCRRALADELGVEPAEETTALYERIRDTASAELSAHRYEKQRLQNFPAQTTVLIGREAELAELGALLENPACRLITIVGPGGIGKTRLALAAAAEQCVAFMHGAAFVPLTAISSAEFLAPAILAALDVELQGQRDPREQLLDDLRAKELLLVLDNVEQLLAADQSENEDLADLLAAILTRAPGVTLLVTSRERLALPREWLFDLAGLNYPPGESVNGIEGYSAVRLFVQRVSQVRRQFALTDGEARAVARICRLVEGLPLAIELAAAALRTRSCMAIADAIESSVMALATEMRAIPDRHRSIRATFEHSWRLLSDQECQVFPRLSVFRGGFEAETAAQVAQATPELLTSLLDKSLLRWDGVARYDMHELVRQYAGEKLEQAGEVEGTKNEHVAYFLRLAETADLPWPGPEKEASLVVLDQEYHNLRAALAWTMEQAQAEVVCRLCKALGEFWDTRGYRTEGREWIHTALAIPDRVSAFHRGQALMTAGELASGQGDVVPAIALLEEALTLFRQLDDQAGIVDILGRLGEALIIANNYSQAVPLFQECLAWAQSSGEFWLIAWHLKALGWAAYMQGDYAKAKPLHEESLALFRKLEDQRGVAYTLLQASQVALYEDDYERAVSLSQESLALFRTLGDKSGIASILGTLAWAALEQDDVEQALPLFEESLAMFCKLGDKRNIARQIEALAAASARTQRHPVMAARPAVRLLGAAAALRDAIGVYLSPADRSLYEPYLAAAHAHLDDAVFATAWAEGRAMTLEQTIAYALEGSEVDFCILHRSRRISTIIGSTRPSTLV